MASSADCEGLPRSVATGLIPHIVAEARRVNADPPDAPSSSKVSGSIAVLRMKIPSSRGASMSADCEYTWPCSRIVLTALVGGNGQAAARARHMVRPLPQGDRRERLTVQAASVTGLSATH